MCVEGLVDVCERETERDRAKKKLFQKCYVCIYLYIVSTGTIWSCPYGYIKLYCINHRHVRYCTIKIKIREKGRIAGDNRRLSPDIPALIVQQVGH